MLKELLVATKNKGKVKEIKHLLRSLRLNILSLLDFPDIPDVKESAATFEGNARKKAVTISKKLKRLVLADDSGLEVIALKGTPGVRSARYAGPNPSTKKLCNKLLKAMKNKKYRWARFVCDIAIAKPDGKVRIVEGICWGKISGKMIGSGGFGYDPVFIPEGYRKTFAQMPLKLKNRISHRAKALKKVADILRKMI